MWDFVTFQSQNFCLNFVLYFSVFFQVCNVESSLQTILSTS